ncbi:carbon monoxide dehydrogenase subunit G [Rhodococcus sp. X156]|uniref:SRPBCC family protein n=1 Tax=Rhodococcus sp. X156 TaxID=2499145 RepID=UPI000FDB649E|nr:carbon monoxide dehydrogenase subunit G [Rhodococcus sp. X156]
MKVSGKAQLHAPVDKVWDALNDPAVLVRTIPGCERLEATGKDEYAMVVTAGVASIKGTYTGEVTLCEQEEPSSFLMKASGAGGPGTVSAEVRVKLADGGDGTTQLTYDADAVIGGAVAGVGQRMLIGVTKKMAGEFFKAVDDVITGKSAAPVAAPVAAPAGAAATTDAGAPVTQPGVFTAPSSPSTAGGLPGLAGDGLLPGAVLGAVLTLVGVLVGGLLGRRR